LSIFSPIGGHSSYRWPRSGPQTAAEAAQSASLSIAVVRTTLNAMGRDQLVSVSRRQPPRGRSVRVYKLAPAGRRLFPDTAGGYAAVILKLIEEHDPTAFHKALGRVQAGTVEFLTSTLNLPPGRLTLQQTLVLANDDGWGVDTSLEGESLEARFFHCPVLQLARIFPSLCELHRQTLSELANAPVEMGEHLLAGSRSCVFHVGYGPAAPDAPELGDISS
jgi:predicted ArsR family transcriptional regulator